VTHSSTEIPMSRRSKNAFRCSARASARATRTLTRARYACLAAATALVASAHLTGQQPSIKIGVIEPLTGAFAASGTYVVNGARIAADEVNAKGGVIGRKLELVIQDNKSNPTEAVAVAEKLIVRDKAPVLMGAWGSGFTLAVMPKLMEYKVPML